MAATCLQGLAQSGHEQSVWRSFSFAGNRLRPAARNAWSMSFGIWPARSSAAKMACLAISDVASSQAAASSAAMRSVTVYGVGRDPVTRAVTRPGSTSRSWTRPARA